MANPDTITLGTDSFDVYGPLADATAYFNGKLNRTSWTGTEGDTRKRSLISASRMLDLINWKGSPTDLDTPQPLAWPRTGVTDKNGSVIVDTVFPTDLLRGYYELAQVIIDNPSLDEESDQGSNIRSVTADVVNVSFFRPVSGTRFPTVVHNFLKQFMNISGSSVGGFSYGTDEASVFDSPSGLLNEPI